MIPPQAARKGAMGTLRDGGTTMWNGDGARSGGEVVSRTFGTVSVGGPDGLSSDQRALWDYLGGYMHRPSARSSAEQARNLVVSGFQYVCSFEGIPVPSRAAVLAEFEATYGAGSRFVPARRPTDAIAVALAGVQDNRCLYCQSPLIPSEQAIEHFVPSVWSINDAIENLVVSCPACRGAKGDLPAARRHIETWVERFLVTAQAGPLAVLAEQERWLTHPYAAVRQARSHFSNPLGTLYWDSGAGAVSLDQPTFLAIERMLSGLEEILRGPMELPW